jgi:hypothetical protein
MEVCDSVPEFIAWIDARLQDVNSDVVRPSTYWRRVWEDAVHSAYNLGIPDAVESLGGGLPCVACEGDSMRKAIRDQLRKRLVGLRGYFNGRPVAIGIEVEKTKPDCEHSEDFTQVTWHGQDYIFNLRQAACIRLLWAEWAASGRGMHERTIGEKIGTNNAAYRLRDTFRVKGGKQHPAWGAMIMSLGGCIYDLGSKTPE